MSFREFLRIDVKFLGEPVTIKGSHHKFETSGYGRGYLTIQPDKGKAKPEQVKEVCNALKQRIKCVNK